MIKRIGKNQRITANWLNTIVDTLNNLAKSPLSPRDANQKITLVEVGRTYTEATVTDTNGDTHIIAQVDTITYRSANGLTLELVHKNPDP